MPTYPYTPSTGGLTKAFEQLRKVVPGKIDAAYFKRHNIAPANESYIIAILRHLGLIDEDGTPVEDATAFLYGNDEAFQKGLEEALRRGYGELFSEMGDDAMGGDKERLTHWFRHADKTTALVGQRQASTFLTVAALAGHGTLPQARATGAKKATTPNGGSGTTTAPAKSAPAKTASPRRGSEGAPKGDTGHGGGQDIGLSVRIEVNLPPDGDAATYDAIFASIKKHLMP